MNDRASQPFRPASGMRERGLFREENVSAPFFRALLVAALAISVALLIAALSARQLSQRDNAMPLLQASVRALTDPEALIASEMPRLRDEAENHPQDPIVVPGFPLEVSLSPDEVRTGNTSTLSNLLVERGAAVVYDEDMGSFDQTGHQDTGLFSAQGIVKRISQRLTAGAHETANRATVVMLGITAVLAVAVVLTYRERRRLRALGIGVLLGGTAGALACVFLGFLADRAGGHDPFTSDVRSIVENVLDVAKRNFAIVGILGVVITGASMLITTARLEEADGYANEDEDEDDLDYGDDDSYDEPHEAEEFDDDDRRDDPGE